MLNTKHTNFWIRKTTDPKQSIQLDNKVAYFIRKAITGKLGLLRLKHDAYKASDTLNVKLRYALPILPHTAVVFDVWVGYNYPDNGPDLVYVEYIDAYSCYIDDDDCCHLLTEQPLSYDDVKDRCRKALFCTPAHQSKES